MNERQPLWMALGLASAALACAPKADTVPPEGGNGAACEQDAKTCEDGSTVSREGPACEFPACPGESEALDADADADADAEADADADADEADADADAEGDADAE